MLRPARDFCYQCERSTLKDGYCAECDGIYVPSPEEIRSHCQAFQETWSPAERRRRSHGLEAVIGDLVPATMGFRYRCRTLSLEPCETPWQLGVNR